MSLSLCVHGIWLQNGMYRWRHFINEKGHRSTLWPCKAVPRKMMITKLVASPSCLLPYSVLSYKTADIVKGRHITNCQRLWGENGWGLEGCIGECAAGGESQLAGDVWNLTPGLTVLIATTFAYRLTAHRLPTNRLTHQQPHQTAVKMCCLQDTCKCVSAVQCNGVLLHCDTYK